MLQGKERSMTTAEMVTCGEGARRIGVAPATLRKVIRRGELQTFRDPLNGRVKLLRVEELDALRNPQPLETRTNTAPQAA
jgi:hypothetical protein